jgi:hypothetical protein
MGRIDAIRGLLILMYQNAGINFIVLKSRIIDLEGQVIDQTDCCNELGKAVAIDNYPSPRNLRSVFLDARVLHSLSHRISTREVADAITASFHDMSAKFTPPL